MKININKKYIIMISLILLIIIGLVALNTTGVLKKIGKTKEQIAEAEAKEKLEQALQNASTQKETDANYNSEEYLTSLLKEQNIIVIDNIVAIDGYNFEIDRESLSITQTLGKSQVTVNSKLLEVLGKNDNGKYRAKAQVTITSNIPIDNMIFQNENGTYSKEKTDELTYTKEMEVEINKQYMITVVTKDGKVNDLKRTIATTDTSDSLLNAVETTILETGYYNIAIEDEVYSIHAYVYDGDTTFSTSQTFGDENDVATASEYAKNMVVVKVNGDLTVDSGKTITAYSTEYGGPKGMLLYTTGNLTNNGTITMTAKGAKAEGQNVYLWKNEVAGTDYNGTGGHYEYIPATGGTGGDSVTGDVSGKVGEGNLTLGRLTAGGGSGGAYEASGATGTACSGAGGKGTSYSGGTGGGGAGAGSSNQTASSGNDYGGKGGAASVTRSGSVRVYGAGGGAGNPGGGGRYVTSGTSSWGEAGTAGTGGLLIIYGQNVINNGNLSANGSAGGNGYNSGGGGSGGGSINIFYRMNFVKGTTQVNGGAAGLVSVSYGTIGGKGGTGTISCGSIATGTYVEYAE